MLPYQDVHGVVDGAAMALAFLTADALRHSEALAREFPGRARGG